MTTFNPFKSGTGTGTLPVNLDPKAVDQVTSWSYPRYLAVLVAILSAVYNATAGVLARTGVTPAVIAASGTLTRPADTTAYASGDLVANNTTAGSVTPLALVLGRVDGGAVRVRRVRLKKSGAVVTNAAFYVHLFTSAPAVSNGDNGAFLPANGGYLGAFSVASMTAFSDSAQGQGAPLVGNDITLAPTVRTVYALIEARGAYTPASAEVFTLTAEVDQA